MASSYFSVSLSGLRRLGAQLTGIAAAVESGAVFPPPAGAEAYQDITSALGDFEQDWSNALARLYDQTRGLGEKASGVGALMADHDDSLAAAFGGGNP